MADTEVLSTSGTVFSRDARAALFFLPCLFSKNWDMSDVLQTLTWQQTSSFSAGATGTGVTLCVDRFLIFLLFSTAQKIIENKNLVWGSFSYVYGNFGHICYYTVKYTTDALKI